MRVARRILVFLATATSVAVVHPAAASATADHDRIAAAAEAALQTNGLAFLLVGDRLNDVPINQVGEAERAHSAVAAYESSIADLAALIADRSGGDGVLLRDDLLGMGLITGHAVLSAISRVGSQFTVDPARSTGPTEFDCSGLTLWSWWTVGVSLPHKAAMQYEVGETVGAEPRAGDLVFFTGGSTAYGPLGIGHVGIYVGQGLMVNARDGVDRVEIEPVDRVPTESELLWVRVPADSSSVERTTASVGQITALGLADTGGGPFAPALVLVVLTCASGGLFVAVAGGRRRRLAAEVEESL